MADFAESAECRRKALLAWFGEAWPHDSCGACDNCERPRETFDATVHAQKMLSCVIRIHQHSGRSMGLGHVVDVLRGKDIEKIRQLGHTALSTYGIGADTSRDVWMSIGRQLIRSGHVGMSDDPWQTVSITAMGRESLSRRSPFVLTRPLAAEGAKRGAREGEIPCDDGLFQVLRALRKSEADARDIAPYMVFGDTALRHMARTYPSDDASFLAVPGVGRQKLTDFGAAFMAAITTWLATNPRQDFGAPPPAKPERPDSGTTPPTALESAALYREGLDIAGIAAARGLKESTITQHLAIAIENGELDADPRGFYGADDEAILAAAAQRHGLGQLGPLHAALEGRYPYTTLHLFRAFQRRREARAIRRS